MRQITEGVAQQIRRLVFEAPEVFQHSLWFSRNAKDATAMPTLHRFAYEGDAQHVGSADFELDVELLSRWIGGASYTELAEAADQAPHPNSLFGGSDLSKRISDATQ